MKYIEMSIEEVMQLCNKHTKVLVAVQDLAKKDEVISFVQKRREEYGQIFEDVQTVTHSTDDFINRLDCFTEKQNILDIKPIGIQKIVLLQ